MRERKPRAGAHAVRSLAFSRAAVDEKARTVALAFSSEAPYERPWGLEVLDHGPSSVRLGRLKDGGPLLLDHDPKRHIGVVEEVSIASERVGRAVVRFSRSDEADAVFRDVVDGIRRHVSVGYVIHQVQDAKLDDGRESVHVTDWEPLEISFVAIPADTSVGVGRAASVPFNSSKGQTAMNSEDVTSMNPDAHRIRSLGKCYRQWLSEADELKHILQGSTFDQVREDVLSRMETRHTDTSGVRTRGDRMSDALDRFSLSKFILQSYSGGLDGVERELSREMMRMWPGNYQNPIPISALFARNMSMNNGTGAASNLMETEMRGDLFAQLLRNRSMVTSLGALVLEGLSGNVDIPRQSVGATPAWLAEAGTASASDQTIPKLTLSPKRISAFTVMTKQAMIQSSLALDNMVRTDLQQQIATAIDAAAINGSGSGTVPRGLLNTTALAGTVAIGANGGAPTWDHIVALEGAVADANGDAGQLGYLVNSKVRSKLKRTQMGTNLGFVWPVGDRPGDGVFGAVNGYRAAVSNNVPSNLTKGTSTTVCSASIFGNWSDAVIAQFGPAFDVVVDPYSKAETAEVRIVVNAFVDFGVRQPGSFSVCLDMLTT